MPIEYSVNIAYDGIYSDYYFHDDEFMNGLMPVVKQIDEKVIIELTEIKEALAVFQRSKFPFIDKALNDLLNIKDISVQSPFKILAYFSILELLLTTFRPRSNDSSLSHQLKKKIALVNNQLKDKIKISEQFKGPDTLTIEILIEKLYQYRNNVAHGNFGDFQNELQILKDQGKQIFPFLLSVTKQVLLFSVKNPELINDLKEC